MRIEELTDAELALRPHRVRGPVANLMLDRGAITPARAIVYTPDGPVANRDLARWRSRNVVRWTLDGRCWFDLRRFYAAQAQRERLRALIAAPVAIVLALVAVAFYRG